MATSTPDWSAWIAQAWGGGSYEEICGFGFGASNVVVGTNPAYTLQDFIAFYPKFGGTPVVLTGATTVTNSPSVAVSSTTGLAVGNPVAGPGIPNGALIKSVDDPTHLTLTAAVTAGATISLTIWNAPPIPFLVISAYIFLASASLVQDRWLEQWPLAVGLMIAHYLTLYARSDGNPTSPIGLIAAQGLSFGITVAKAVGDVSVSYSPITGLEDWGAWNLTSYGQQLATLAKVIGSGPMLLW